MDGWNTTFLLGRPIFRGKKLVSGRVTNGEIWPSNDAFPLSDVSLRFKPYEVTNMLWAYAKLKEWNAQLFRCGFPKGGFFRLVVVGKWRERFDLCTSCGWETMRSL